MQLFYVCERIKLGDLIAHKQNAANVNLTCTTSSEEVKVRKQPDEANKYPSVLRICFLVDFSFVSRHFGLSSLTWLKRGGGGGGTGGSRGSGGCQTVWKIHLP